MEFHSEATVCEVKMDRYVFDTLMPDLVGHDRHAGAFLVFLFLWWQAGLPTQKTTSKSLAEIAEGTGLSRRAVQSALKRLSARKLVSVQRAGITAVPTYSVERPWHRPRGSE